MLTQPTLDTLQTLKLSGRYQALVEQLQMVDIAALSFEERFGLLVDRELTARDNRRLTTRLRQAKLRQTACIEAIDSRHPRGFDKALMARLVTCQWVREHHNVLITGPTGIGKTWLGTQGLSRRLDGAVPPAPQIPSSITGGERRRTLWKTPDDTGEDRLATPG